MPKCSKTPKPHTHGIELPPDGLLSVATAFCACSRLAYSTVPPPPTALSADQLALLRKGSFAPFTYQTLSLGQLEDSTSLLSGLLEGLQAVLDLRLRLRARAVVKLIDRAIDELEFVLDEAERAGRHGAVADAPDALAQLLQEGDEVLVVLFAARDDDEVAARGHTRDGRAKGREDGEVVLVRHLDVEDSGGGEEGGETCGCCCCCWQIGEAFGGECG